LLQSLLPSLLRRPRHLHLHLHLHLHPLSLPHLLLSRLQPRWLLQR
jgi:hypothetical protein